MLYIVKLMDIYDNQVICLLEDIKEKEARRKAKVTADYLAKKGKSKVLNSKSEYRVVSAVSLELTGLVREGKKSYGVIIVTDSGIKEKKIDNLLVVMDAIEEVVLKTSSITIEKRIYIRELSKEETVKQVKVEQAPKTEEQQVVKEAKGKDIEELKGKYKLKEIKKVYELSELEGYYTFKELLAAYTVEELESEYNTEAELIKLSEEVKIKAFMNLTNMMEIQELERYYTEKEIAGVVDKEEMIGYYQSLSTLSELYKIEELGSHYTLDELSDYYNLQEMGIGLLVKYFDTSAIINTIGDELSEEDRLKLAGYVKKNGLEHTLTRAELETIGLEG